MKFAKYLHEELIFLDLPYHTKSEVIECLVHVICKYYNLPIEKEILKDVWERESIKSTGLGKGLAIPHARIDTTDRFYIAFAHSEQGVDWGSIDNKPVHYIFFIVGPTKLEEEYLEALSDISRIMIRQEVREGVHHAQTPSEVISIIRESGTRNEIR